MKEKRFAPPREYPTHRVERCLDTWQNTAMNGAPRSGGSARSYASSPTRTRQFTAVTFGSRLSRPASRSIEASERVIAATCARMAPAPRKVSDAVCDVGEDENYD